MTAGRPTNEAAAIRTDCAHQLREKDLAHKQNIKELNAKHQQVVKFYEARQQEDAQTISELAAKVDALEKAALDVLNTHRPENSWNASLCHLAALVERKP